MWSVQNSTPYAAGKTWGRDKDGIHEWIVAVRGAFDIKPDGILELAAEQQEPLLAPEYNGEEGKSSLRYDADLISLKPTTDIVLNGTAYAPEGRPSTGFLVSLRVGEVCKELKVIGSRTWRQGLFGGSRSEMEPVTEVPIVYERTYGGWDQSNPAPKNQRFEPRNPVGCGMIALLGDPLPNIEYPGMRLRAAPAGFGAIASSWSPRLELNGTYDEAWQKKRYPLLPEDWDPRSLLCSPADQRPNTHLRGGEPVELINLTPDGRLSFLLPRVHLRFRTLIDGRSEEHEGRLATVIIEPDYPRVIMVWQSTLPVRNDGEYLEHTAISEKRKLR